MLKMLIMLALIPTTTLCLEDKWLEHTYHNDSDNAVEIVTQYAQVTQNFACLPHKRALHSYKTYRTVEHTLNPHESKQIFLKGDPLSAHRVLSGSIKVYDLDEHDHAILPTHNVQKNNTFTICRNKKDKLVIRASQY